MNAISEQAARWAVLDDSGSLGADERRALESWLAADPRHRGAYIRACAQWLDLDRLAALNGPSLAVPAAALPPSALPPSALPPTAVPPTALPRSARQSTRWSRRQLLAASVATVAVGSVSWVILSRRERYSSGLGEVRRIVLDDGSVLSLNTATEVAVDFSRQQRNLRLIRGEALFEVAHDSARPFVVSAGGSAVRAVGTAFAVRIEPHQVDVTVTEGVVEVTTRSTSTSSATSVPQRVTRNERVRLGDAHAPTVSAIAAADAERRLAWREGMVSFDGESLQNAVAEINRYNRRRIVVDDAALAAMPVVGIFRANDLDSFSAAAASALKARAVVEGDVIRLMRSTVR